jgi:CubicO group peptidase (beta-lactamase class C family)
MNSKFHITLVILSLTFLTFCQAQEKIRDKTVFPVLPGAYLGQKPPGITPEPFAPNLLPEKYCWHSAPPFSPEKKKVHFSAFIRAKPYSERIMPITSKDWSQTSPKVAASSGEQNDILTKNLIHNIENSASKWFSDYDIPGMAIAVVNNQGILWEAEFGYATDEKTVAVDSQTLFSLQSISKNVTALAVLKAVQDGLLDLDVPITHYLPEFTVKSRFEKNPEQKITLRHLLSHWSGLANNAPVGNYYDSNPHRFEDHINSISETWFKYPVGYCFTYSNLGIDLAGYILQKVTGQSFEEYVKTSVLDPLDMKRSTFNIDMILASSDCAHGHHDEYTSPPVEIPMIPAGGFYSNIEDMAKLVQFHINKGAVREKQLLSKDLIEQMHSVAFPIKGQESGYGLCIELERINQKVNRLYHTGSGYGFMCAMHIYPALNIGVVLLYNSHDTRARNECYEVIDETISELIEKEGSVEVNTFVEGLNPVYVGDPRIKDIIGIYLPYIKIEIKDKQLIIGTERGSGPLQIYSRDDKKLVGLVKNRHYLQFLPPLKGKTKGDIRFLTYAGTSMMYNYHYPIDEEDNLGPNKSEWQKYVGKYHAFAWIKENQHNFEISTENGYICIDSKRCEEYLPGLFFTADGEALDLRGDQPKFMNFTLIKKSVF